VMESPLAYEQKQVPAQSTVTTQIPMTRTTAYDEKISENQITDSAKEKIREFSKNSSLNLTFKEINHQPHADLYWFDLNHQAFFIVNNVTGRVQSANWYEVGSKKQKEITILSRDMLLQNRIPARNFRSSGILPISGVLRS